MNYILFDDHAWKQLLPITFTRPVADIRVGILTIREKWEKLLGVKTSTLTEKYLSKKFPLKIEEKNILINGSVLPNEVLVNQVKSLNAGEGLHDKDDNIIAFFSSKEDLEQFPGNEDIEYKDCVKNILKISFPWDIFSLNEKALQDDFSLLIKGKKSQIINPSNNLIGGGEVFMEEGAKVHYASFNTTDGPIYIGKDSEVMEGSLIRGPFALCDHSVVKMGAKIYGATTIGPHCKVGGEVNNAVFLGYSNKAHDGFLGNSVIGEWCNLGADTNTSNLKNSYDMVRIWSFDKQTFVDTGLQFCGLIMGDHSKCGINTMFNTGSVVGVNANIFGSGFQRNFIPSFSWGGTQGFKPYNINKAIEVAKVVFSRRNLEFDALEQKVLEGVLTFSQSIR